MTRFIYAISGGKAAYPQDAQVTANPVSYTHLNPST